MEQKFDKPEIEVGFSTWLNILNSEVCPRNGQLTSKVADLSVEKLGLIAGQGPLKAKNPQLVFRTQSIRRIGIFFKTNLRKPLSRHQIGSRLHRLRDEAKKHLVELKSISGDTNEAEETSKTENEKV